jgi:hypothetical protein
MAAVKELSDMVERFTSPPPLPHDRLLSLTVIDPRALLHVNILLSRARD